MSERRKIIIEVEPYEEPPQPPPVRCVLCGEMKVPYWLRRDSVVPLCFECDCSGPYRRLPYDAGIAWSDHEAYHDAIVVLNFLELEINAQKTVRRL